VGGGASKFAYKLMFKPFKINFADHPKDIQHIRIHFFKNTVNFGIKYLVISSFFCFEM
jgi:hypothetical protein